MSQVVTLNTFRNTTAILSDYVKPLKKCTSHIVFFSKAQKYFNVTTPDYVLKGFSAASRGKHGCNFISYGAYLIDLTGPSQASEKPNTCFTTAAKVAYFFLKTLDFINASIEFGLIEKASIAAFNIGTLPILDVAEGGLLFFSASCTLVNLVVYESPFDAANDKERHDRWVSIGWAVFDVTISGAIIGSSVAGVSPTPIILFALTLSLANDTVKGYNYCFSSKTI